MILIAFYRIWTTKSVTLKGKANAFSCERSQSRHKLWVRWMSPLPWSGCGRVFLSDEQEGFRNICYLLSTFLLKPFTGQLRNTFIILTARKRGILVPLYREGQKHRAAVTRRKPAQLQAQAPLWA